MSLGYQWRPMGAERSYPGVGDLIPYEHRVYRVVEIKDVPEADWSDEVRRMHREYGPRVWQLTRPRMFTIRLASKSDDCTDRNDDLHFRLGGDSGHSQVNAYPDQHYPICAQCREPLPCRDQMATRTAIAAIAKMGRYETAGVCPACEEPVTARQKSFTWQDNVEIPGGPPVTFHARGRCWSRAANYEASWVNADPDRRRATLSCRGRITNHNDGTYECSEFADCPGIQARHSHLTRCTDPECHALGSFGCTPSRNSTRRES